VFDNDGTVCLSWLRARSAPIWYQPKDWSLRDFGVRCWLGAVTLGSSELHVVRAWKASSTNLVRCLLLGATRLILDHDPRARAVALRHR
jgi:hypothetical protein